MLRHKCGCIIPQSKPQFSLQNIIYYQFKSNSSCTYVFALDIPGHINCQYNSEGVSSSSSFRILRASRLSKCVFIGLVPDDFDDDEWHDVNSRRSTVHGLRGAPALFEWIYKQHLHSHLGDRIFIWSSRFSHSFFRIISTISKISHFFFFSSLNSKKRADYSILFMN